MDALPDATNATPLTTRIVSVEHRCLLLATRLDRLEDDMATMRRVQDCQDLAARHADSQGELGRPFSGVRLCGMCVKLVVCDLFSPDGSFPGGSCNDIIVVLNECDLMAQFRSHVWTRNASVAWKWDEDIRREWGAAKCDEVRARMRDWYRDDPDRPDTPSTEDVGAGPSHHRHAMDAIYEAALRSRHPGLLAVGRAGLAVTKSCGIGKAVAIMDAIAADLGCKNRMGDTFRVHRIAAHLSPLAIATLAEEGFGRNPLSKAEWMALTETTRKRLGVEQCRLMSFFNRERVSRCR